MSWLDSTAADCPLSYMGVTFYGAIDVGAGYETNASRFNGAYPQGVNELISKMSNGGRWQLVPNGLVQSNIGVKIKEQIAPNWYIISDVNAGFDPYSLRFANGPQSAAENNFNTLGNQTANADSSRTWGWDNSRAYIGVNNTTLGTLTFGRQYSFTNDASANYDPFGGAYAFSLIGNSSTVLAGTGDTELARYNTSVKYQVAYNGFRAGGLVQAGRYEQGNGSNGAAQVDLGADFSGFSVDAIYAYAKDAVKFATYGGSAIPVGDPTDTLEATLANVNAAVLAAKYKWNALTLFGGYEYSRLSDPSDTFGATPTANGDYLSALAGGYPAVVQKLAYVTPEDLQVLWLGAKYGVLSNLDVAAGYYLEWQNNYTSQYTKYNTGGSSSAFNVGCGPNLNPAITGATPQGSNSSACAGTTNVVGAMIDWRPVKRVDVYAGLMYSVVAGGMANGYIQNNNTAFTAGVKLAF
jgi:predicted porin